MVLEYVKHAVTQAVDLVLPARCAICGAEGTFIYANCFDEFPELNEPQTHTRVGPTSEIEVRSSWVMEDSARNLAHQLKYGGFKAVTRPLGVEMAHLIRRWGIRPDAIAYVPLHKSTLRRRGFDQLKPRHDGRG